MTVILAIIPVVEYALDLHFLHSFNPYPTKIRKFGCLFFNGCPSKGTVFHTLYKNDTKPIGRRVSLSKLTPTVVNKDNGLAQIDARD